MSPAISKLQRQLDLIAFLLARRFPVTAEQIMEGVPAYAQDLEGADERAKESTRRKFERDKDDLKQLGIPFESVTFSVKDERAAEGGGTGYRLGREDFYLPYVRLLAEGRDEQDLAPLGIPRGVFTLREDAASLATEALHTVAELPDFPFRRQARSAQLKLEWDTGALPGAPQPVLLVEQPETERVRDRVALLGDALTARKRVTFRYHGIHRNQATDRDMAPYGLFLKYGNWYLVGHDATRDALRTFRLGRMESVEVNRKKPKDPDYQIPDDFELRAWADREAWELGSDRALEVDVDFRFPRSLWAARNEHGTVVEDLEDGAQRRRFRVRQTEPFLRWILSLAGDATVASPPEVARALDDLATSVARRYEQDPEDAGG